MSTIGAVRSRTSISRRVICRLQVNVGSGTPIARQVSNLRRDPAASSAIKFLLAQYSCEAGRDGGVDVLLIPEARGHGFGPDVAGALMSFLLQGRG